MALKIYKPTTNGRRGMTGADFSCLTKDVKPEKKLLERLTKTGGRNNAGRVTAWQRGGGHKRRYRVIDFKRDKQSIPAKVATIEYDPNRSCHIALLNYVDGEKRYILAPVGLKEGDMVMSGEGSEIRAGNTLPLRNIPQGTQIHNLELKKGKGGQLVRSAGSYAQIMAKEGKYAQVRMPSREVRKIHLDCLATIGQVGNIEHENIKIGKAGRTRWMGKRSSVRGVAMNPIDHPLGGGEGKSAGGRHPCTPWGKPTKGKKTRKNLRTDEMIVKRRTKK